jgi:hypothetical protein
MERHRRAWGRLAAGVGTLLLLLVAAGVVYRAVTAAPGPQVDYHRKVYELSRTAQPAAPDRWSEFRGILAAIDTEIRSEGLFDYMAIRAFASPYHAAAEEREALTERGRRLIGRYRNHGIFEHTAGLTAVRTATRPPADGLMFIVLLPHVSEARHLGLIQAGRMCTAGEQRDWEDFLAALREGLVLARISAAQGILVEYGAGVVIETMLLQQIPPAIASGEPDVAVVEELLEIIQSHHMAPLPHAVEGDRMMALDLIQRVHTDDGDGDGSLIISRLAGIDLAPHVQLPAGLADYSIVNAGAPLFPSRAETVRDMNELYDRQLADAATPVWQRSEPFNPDGFIESLPRRQVVLRMLSPFGTWYQDVTDQRATIRAGVELLIRIERHCLLFGEAPATLEALVDADHDVLILDPMTGRPFIYWRGSGPGDYILYAAGRDLQDDGGVWPQEKPPEVALHPGAEGTDYPLRPARAPDDPK